MKIGVLEDDPIILALYEAMFVQQSLQSSLFSSISDFIEGLRQESFDLLILDWTLPDGEADVVIKWVRENLGWEIPIIVVSASDDEPAIVSALWLGADDYVVKPIRVNELIARILSQGRRSESRNSRTIIAHPPYRIDLRENQIAVAGKNVPLTQKEFDLASLLFGNAGKLISRIQAMHRVWGQSADINTRTIDAHVSKIRKKLNISPANGWQLLSVYGYGYRLERVSDNDA